MFADKKLFAKKKCLQKKGSPKKKIAEIFFLPKQKCLSKKILVKTFLRKKFLKKTYLPKPFSLKKSLPKKNLQKLYFTNKSCLLARKNLTTENFDKRRLAKKKFVQFFFAKGQPCSM